MMNDKNILGSFYFELAERIVKRLMKIAVYPGSFDPVTNGHIDILERSNQIFDKIIVAVVHNLSKCALFSLDERVNFIKESTQHLENVEVECFNGLLVDFLKVKNSKIVIRGLRSIIDFEYESHMSMVNRQLSPDTETIFIMSDKNYICVSSSVIKEIALLGGDVSGMVPPIVQEYLEKKLQG